MRFRIHLNSVQAHLLCESMLFYLGINSGRVPHVLTHMMSRYGSLAANDTMRVLDLIKEWQEVVWGTTEPNELFGYGVTIQNTLQDIGIPSNDFLKSFELPAINIDHLDVECEQQISLSSSMTAVSRALDLFTRVGIGQFELLPEDHVLWNDALGNDHDRYDTSNNENLRLIKELTLGLKAGCFALRNDSVHNRIRVAYDMLCIIRYHECVTRQFSPNNIWLNPPAEPVGDQPFLNVQPLEQQEDI